MVSVNTLIVIVCFAQSVLHEWYSEPFFLCFFFSSSAKVFGRKLNLGLLVAEKHAEVHKDSVLSPTSPQHRNQTHQKVSTASESRVSFRC